MSFVDNITKPTHVIEHDFFQDKKISGIAFLQTLYPITNQTQLTKKNTPSILKRMLKTIELTARAVQAFMNNQLELFDAHVGETACQIRAGLIIYFANRPKEKNNLLNEFNIVQNISATLEHYLNEYKMGKYEIKCLNDLGENIRNARLSTIITVLSALYALSHFKGVDSEGISQFINFSKAQVFLESSFHFTKKYCHHLQRYVAKISVQFSKSIAYNILQNKNIFNRLESLTFSGEKNRVFLPIFISNYLINQYLLATACPVNLKIKRGNDIFNFYYKPHQKKLIPTTRQNILNKPIYVVYAVSDVAEITPEFKKKLDHYMQALQLIDFNVAAHKQLPGQELDHISEKFYDTQKSLSLMPGDLFEYFHYCCKMSDSLGCTLSNRHFLLTKHVYASFLDDHAIR